MVGPSSRLGAVGFCLGAGRDGTYLRGGRGWACLGAGRGGAGPCLRARQDGARLGEVRTALGGPAGGSGVVVRWGRGLLRDGRACLGVGTK